MHPILSSLAFRHYGLNRLANMVDDVGAAAFARRPGNPLAGAGGRWPDDTVSYTYNNRFLEGVSPFSPLAVELPMLPKFPTAARFVDRMPGACLGGGLHLHVESLGSLFCGVFVRARG